METKLPVELAEDWKKFRTVTPVEGIKIIWRREGGDREIVGKLKKTATGRWFLLPRGNRTRGYLLYGWENVKLEKENETAKA